MIEALIIGLVGGVVAGLMGVGGGVIFVPGLYLFLNLTQQQAEGTSLLAIVPVAVVGAFLHDRHHSVRRRDGTIIGAVAVGGAAGGVAIANALPGAELRVAFALLLLYVAGHLMHDALGKRRGALGRRQAGARQEHGADGDG
ncbi:MAG: sulfite exporter TauE/SafE family protein [Solirubrobacteraceae bacterium]